MNGKRNWKSSMLVYFLILFLISVLVSLFVGGPSGDKIYEEISFQAFVERIKYVSNDNPVYFQPKGDELWLFEGKWEEKYQGIPDSSKTSTHFKTIISSDEKKELLVLLKERNIEPIYREKDKGNWFLGIVISLLPIFLIFVLLMWMMGKTQQDATKNGAFTFGKSKARLSGSQTDVTFDDVAGCDEAKLELQEIVDFLRTPEKFQALGAKIPKGVLLIGPPGTGKTLMAKAVAGEAGVPFFSGSGSEFVEMFVGVGASRVRDLFEQAKRNAPCIVFIDELDAVGRHRGAGLGGGHDEREQTLNQILVELDGFDKRASVILLAATNRPDILDPALLRPGRFDRQVVLDMPDIKGRLAILQIHARGKPFAQGVNLEKLAQQTPGFSGADLANLLNEATILAVRAGKSEVGQEELEEAIDKVIFGSQRKSRVISPKEKEITAYHEAGHALVGWVLPRVDPVHKISIVMRGRTGGYTKLLPDEDRTLLTESQLRGLLAAVLGGRIAEIEVFGEPSTGAENDLEKVRETAWNMVSRWGMGKDLLPQAFGKRQEMIFLGKEISEQRDYSEETARKLDEAREEIIKEARDTAAQIIRKYRNALGMVARKLLEAETLEGKELESVFLGVPKNKWPLE